MAAIYHNPPEKFSYGVIDHQAVHVSWLPVLDVVRYEVKVEGHRDIIATDQTSVTLQGLLPLVKHVVQVRSVFPSGASSEWAMFTVQTSYGVPQTPPGRYSVLEPIATYNNALEFEMPDSYGTTQFCTLRIWWQPSDSGWWCDLEVPTGTPAILGRRLGLNCGILDDAEGVLPGNIVMRSATTNGTNEPDSECFKNHTHQLRWEPKA